MIDEYFEELIDQYGKKVYNLAFRLTGSREDSEDIMQDTFLEVYKGLEAFRGESKVYTWIYKIAYNHCIRLYKSKSKPMLIQSLDENIHEAESLMADKANWFEDPEESAITTALLKEIRSLCNYFLIYRLPENQRTVYIMRVMFSLSPQEISDIIGCSENAVKARLNRARKSLAELVAQKNKTCQWLNQAKTDCCRSRLGIALTMDYDLLTRVKTQAFGAGLIGRAEMEPPAKQSIDELFKRFPELSCHTDRLYALPLR